MRKKGEGISKEIEERKRKKIIGMRKCANKRKKGRKKRRIRESEGNDGTEGEFRERRRGKKYTLVKEG